MRVKKIIITVIISLLIIWLIIGTTDYLRVKSFEMPIFCVRSSVFQEGGSVHYSGLGYSFNITGNFMAEDELPGITEYTFQIFGIHAASGVRD